MAVTKYIVFHLNDQKYSMKLTKINGIEYVYHVVPVPMGPACIKGIIHLRNEVIPVSETTVWNAGGGSRDAAFDHRDTRYEACD